MPTFQYSGRRKSGHGPGHIREAFCDAGDAFVVWVDSGRSGPEPTVTVGSHEPHEMTLSRACGLLWNCSDNFRAVSRSSHAGPARSRRSAPTPAARAMRAVLTR
jgi:hypothetical protein